MYGLKIIFVAVSTFISKSPLILDVVI